MNGQDAYAARLGLLRLDLALIRRVVGVGIAQFVQFIDEARQARIAPAIDIERQQQQFAQIGCHASGHGGRHGTPIPREHLTLMVNPIEQIVRGQSISRHLPVGQQACRTCQTGRCAIGDQRIESMPPGRLTAPSQLHQFLVAAGKDRRTQRVGQLEVIERRHEKLDQRRHVTNLDRRQQPATRPRIEWNSGRAQRAFINRQAGTAADENKNIVVARRPHDAIASGILVADLPGQIALPDNFTDFLRQRLGFLAPTSILRLDDRFGQRITQTVTRRRRFDLVLAGQRQQRHPSRHIFHQRRLLAEWGKFRRIEKHGVDHVDHWSRVASRHILFATHRSIVTHQKISGNGEETRLGTTEAID